MTRQPCKDWMFTATPNREKLLLPICHQALMKGRSLTTCSAETGATETLVALQGNAECRLARCRYRRRRCALLILVLDHAHLSLRCRAAVFTSCCSAKTTNKWPSVVTVAGLVIAYLSKIPANSFFGFLSLFILTFCVVFVFEVGFFF